MCLCICFCCRILYSGLFSRITSFANFVDFFKIHEIIFLKNQFNMVQDGRSETSRYGSFAKFIILEKNPLYGIMFLFFLSLR